MHLPGLLQTEIQMMNKVLVQMAFEPSVNNYPCHIEWQGDKNTDSCYGYFCNPSCSGWYTFDWSNVTTDDPRTANIPEEYKQMQSYTNPYS